MRWLDHRQLLVFTLIDHELDTYPALDNLTMASRSTITFQREIAMKRKVLRLGLMAGVLSLPGMGLGLAQAADEAQEHAELAKALTGTKVYLQDGLMASASHGKPISAKFEVDNGKLQLSVYTMKGNSFSEVSVFPEIKAGHPVANVTLLRDNAFKTVSEKLE
jgi:hypothetical protein